MAEKRRGGRIGCILGCVGLLLVGGVGLLVLLLVVGGGSVAYLYTARDAAELERMVAEIEAEREAAAAAEAAHVEAMTEEAGEAGAAEVEPAVEAASAAQPEAGEADEEVAAPAPAPVAAPAPRPAPRPAPAAGSGDDFLEDDPFAAPEDVPEPAAATGGGQVAVEGSADVVLIQGGSRHPVPGTVPPGRYEIEATFSDGSPVNVGKITVDEGGDHVVRCNENMGICRGS